MLYLFWCWMGNSIAEPKAVYTQEIQSIEFGTVDLVIEVEAEIYTLILLDGKGVRKQSAVLPKDGHDIFVENLEIDVATFDANADGKEDYLIRTEMMITAGPQAGMSVYDYYPLIFTKDGLVSSQYRIQMYNDVPDIEHYSDVPSLVTYLQYCYKHGKPPRMIGIEYPKGSFSKLLVQDDELVLYTMEIEGSSKRMTVALDKNAKYIVYRFGKNGTVDLEMKQTSKESAKVQYYREDNYGFSRFFLKHIEFSNGDYTYRIFNNSIESTKTVHPNGTGILVINVVTGKQTLLKGKPETVKGDLQDFEKVSFIEHKTHYGDDYADE